MSQEIALPPFVFPAVLPKMMYSDQMSSATTSRVVLSAEQCRGIIRRYLTEMYAGVEYERQIYEPWNRDNPNTVEVRNVDNANRIGARLNRTTIMPVLGRIIPGLPNIPPDADLFASDQFDESAGMALADLDDCKGLEASTASKLLHQKRPSFFPIFDTYARQAQTIPWGREYGPRSYLPLLRRARAIYFIEHNQQAVDAIVTWLASEPNGVRIRLPRVRIIDILAWGSSRPASLS